MNRWRAVQHGDEWWIHNEARDYAPALIEVDAEKFYDAEDDDGSPDGACAEAKRVAGVIVDALNAADAEAPLDKRIVCPSCEGKGWQPDDPEWTDRRPVAETGAPATKSSPISTGLVGDAGALEQPVAWMVEYALKGEPQRTYATTDRDEAERWLRGTQAYRVDYTIGSGRVVPLYRRAQQDDSSGWRPIESAPMDDRAKPEDRVVLVAAPGWTFPEIAWWVSPLGELAGYWTSGDDDDLGQIHLEPTVWQPPPPLPTPPRAPQEGTK